MSHGIFFRKKNKKRKTCDIVLNLVMKSGEGKIMSKLRIMEKDEEEEEEAVLNGSLIL
jgi:hypothetical protein